MHFYVKLALTAIERYLTKKEIMEPPMDEYPDLHRQAGLFVSLKKGESLRGCIGTIGPKTKNIGYEIIYNAVSSATRDPRFNPVAANELETLSCTIDILGPPKLIASVEELDPEKYGIIVNSRGRQAILLPNLDGIGSVIEQIEIAKRKANITLDEYVEIYKFTTERYS